MRDEYWATFSIYDYETPAYRQALVLFDRIVVPVPTREYKGITAKTIDHLSAEVEWLEKRGAARKVDWDPDEFDEWRKSPNERVAGESEALARRLSKDPPHQTRLLLKQNTENRVARALPEDVLSVTAVPVFGTQSAYDTSAKDLENYLQQQVMLDVILPQIAMPSETASFDDILITRDRPAFQASLRSLREWQRNKVCELLDHPDEAGMKRAAADFARMVEQYREALNDARYEKLKTAVCTMLGIGAALAAAAGPLVGTLAGLASPLFSVRSLRRPCWKDLEDKQCFPAGVVYQAEELA